MPDDRSRHARRTRTAGAADAGPPAGAPAARRTRQATNRSTPPGPRPDEPSMPGTSKPGLHGSGLLDGDPPGRSLPGRAVPVCGSRPAATVVDRAAIANGPSSAGAGVEPATRRSVEGTTRTEIERDAAGCSTSLGRALRSPAGPPADHSGRRLTGGRDLAGAAEQPTSAAPEVSPPRSRHGVVRRRRDGRGQPGRLPHGTPSSPRVRPRGRARGDVSLYRVRTPECTPDEKPTTAAPGL
ncbi:hypothetical protein FHR81_000052 [Actinoalloteichus hoggarensis]|uniref:Uncharacterized protein n=1 Tax=Actinoalloteichus hoggarensis TaxID=1470176 RepID=A0A221W3L3_9PSEU|nr:hypothetical protein AHOG_13100 [Actinoalloteichus hoggarensis]MBB5919023.1 hypothetical protein [Actinoalloteichus hoggarensis]